MFLIYLLLITEIQTSPDEINAAQDAGFPLLFPQGVSPASASKPCGIPPLHPQPHLQGACLAGTDPAAQGMAHPAESGQGQWERDGKEGAGQGECVLRGCWRLLAQLTRAEQLQLVFMRLLFPFRVMNNPLFLAAAAIAHLYLPNHTTLLLSQLCFCPAKPLGPCAKRLCKMGIVQIGHIHSSAVSLK